VLENKKTASEESVWIFGGRTGANVSATADSTHVLARRDVNVFVFDTEVYFEYGRTVL
jgi:pyruvate/2-oxoacid:ferredoxin oxidoreductase beta subunit